MIAKQQTNAVGWRHENAVTGSLMDTTQSGTVIARMEADPMGVDVGVRNPYLNPVGPRQPFAPAIPTLFGDVEATGGQCMMDGITVGCAGVSRLMDSGAAVQAPAETIAPIYSQSQGRFVGFARWNQTAAVNAKAWNEAVIMAGCF